MNVHCAKSCDWWTIVKKASSCLTLDDNNNSASCWSLRGVVQAHRHRSKTRFVNKRRVDARKADPYIAQQIAAILAVTFGEKLNLYSLWFENKAALAGWLGRSFNEAALEHFNIHMLQQPAGSLTAINYHRCSNWICPQSKFVISIQIAGKHQCPISTTCSLSAPNKWLFFSILSVVDTNFKNPAAAKWKRNRQPLETGRRFVRQSSGLPLL